MSPKVSPTRQLVYCPLDSLRREWKRDTELKPPLRAHMLSMVRGWKRAMPEATIPQRMLAVYSLLIYRAAREKRPEPLTAARCLAESTRALRTLGMHTGKDRGPVKPSRRASLLSSVVK